MRPMSDAPDQETRTDAPPALPPTDYRAQRRRDDRALRSAHPRARPGPLVALTDDLVLVHRVLGVFSTP